MMLESTNVALNSCSDMSVIVRFSVLMFWFASFTPALVSNSRVPGRTGGWALHDTIICYPDLFHQLTWSYIYTVVANTCFAVSFSYIFFQM